MNSQLAPTGYQGNTQRLNKNILPKGHEYGQLQQFIPEQMGRFLELLKGLGPDSYLGKLASGDQGMFNQMEQPALRQFAQQQGSLASRFSSMGMGGRKSSGFQNALGQASSDFAQNLQAQRLNLQRQALADMMGYNQMLLGQRPFEQFLIGKEQKQHQPSFIERLIPGLMGGVGAAGGAYYGGPKGAAAGYQIGSSIGNAFSGQNNLPNAWSSQG